MSLAGLTSDVAALATRIAQQFNTQASQFTALLAGKADDSAAVHKTGAETIAGAKTFTTAPLVPTPGSPGNPVRNDDARNSDARAPLSGSVVNASVAGGAAIEETKLALASDAAAGVASRRTLGTGAQQAAAGNHTHAATGGTPGIFSVTSYGAVGNGTADDTAAINSAIAAALAVGSGIVWFPAGTYGTTSVIDIPENVTLAGVHGDTIPYDTSPPSPCVIRPLASHTGTAILRMRGRSETGRGYDHVGARVRNLTLDGTNTPAGTKGVQVAALVREARFEYVTVNAVKDTSFWFGAGTVATSTMPQSLRLIGCLAKASGNNGYTFTNVPDTTIIDCNSLGATNTGFYIAGFMNGQITNIRAEWSGQHGLLLTSGYWGAGQGSGGCIIASVTTDRNGFNGCYVDATGAGTLQINGMVNRRDGRNNKAGGGGYAGLAVASGATMPVIVDNLQVYPGVDDDGTGTNSPQYGVYAPGASVVNVDSGYVFAAVTAISGGSGLTVDNSVGTATGLTSAPARVAPVADVPVTQRGPIGGIVTLADAATIAVNASTGVFFRGTVAGNRTMGLPTGGVDGQELLFELTASGARTVNFSAYETGGIVTSTSVAIASGKTAYVRTVNRGGVWRLLAVDPGS